MKYFRDFLKKILRHPPAATEGAETPGEDRDRKVLEPVTEYSEESSFGWPGSDGTDSSIFGPGASTAQKQVRSKTDSSESRQRTHSSLGNACQDEGFDPYNTGTFDPSGN